MMRRALSLASLALLLTCPMAAQQADDEAKFNTKQADRLHKFAKDAFKKGFPRQAKIIWLQAIKLYDRQHEGANTALGRVKVGKSWNPKKDFVYPREDTGSGAQGKALFKRVRVLEEVPGSRAPDAGREVGQGRAQGQVDAPLEDGGALGEGRRQGPGRR